MAEYRGIFPPSYLALRRLVRVGGLESDLHLLPAKEFHAETSELDSDASQRASWRAVGSKKLGIAWSRGSTSMLPAMGRGVSLLALKAINVNAAVSCKSYMVAFRKIGKRSAGKFPQR